MASGPVVLARCERQPGYHSLDSPRRRDPGERLPTDLAPNPQNTPAVASLGKGNGHRLHRDRRGASGPGAARVCFATDHGGQRDPVQRPVCPYVHAQQLRPRPLECRSALPADRPGPYAAARRGVPRPEQEVPGARRNPAGLARIAPRTRADDEVKTPTEVATVTPELRAPQIRCHPCPTAGRRFGTRIRSSSIQRNRTQFMRPASLCVVVSSCATFAVPSKPDEWQAE